MSEFKQYRRSQIAELCTWGPGDDMSAVSVSQEDAKAGSPKAGDMIARNPKNHADQWLVAARYFADNFEPMGTSAATEPTGAELIAVLSVEDIRGCIGAPGRIPDGQIEDVRKFIARAIAPGGIAHTRLAEQRGGAAVGEEGGNG
jgi:hypothetical protein